MDKNAGKYDTLYKEEFELAQAILKTDGGALEWGVHDYEVFTYKKEGVRLVFYPHRTTAGHYHIRVRNCGSQDKEEAENLMALLDVGAGSNCTFTHKVSGKPTYKTKYIPVTPGGTICEWLESDTEQEAWDKLFVDSVHMPYQSKEEYIERGYTVEELKV